MGIRDENVPTGASKCFQMLMSQVTKANGKIGKEMRMTSGRRVRTMAGLRQVVQVHAEEVTMVGVRLVGGLNTLVGYGLQEVGHKGRRQLPLGPMRKEVVGASRV